MRRVPGKLHDRIRRRMEKQGVKFPLIGVDQGIQFSWTGKYQMVIIYIQNTFPLCVDPQFIGKRLAHRAEKRKDRPEAIKVFEAATAGSGSPVEHLREKEKVPYGYLANDGLIEYNGVTFVCDERTNSICLGDVSDKENTLTIPLAGGGCLKVNRANLEQLAAAIGMFSPEDVNRILNAIAQDNRARSMEMELEEEKSDVVEIAAGEAEKKDGEAEN